MGITAQLLEGYTGTKFMQELGWLVVVIVSIAGALMTLYAVYIGFLFATASDANKRKAAKDRLIKTVASALIVIALSAVLGVINVNFNTVQGNEKKITPRENTVQMRNYTYNGDVIMTLNYKQEQYPVVTGSITLDRNKIVCNGDPINETVILQGCSVAAWRGHFSSEVNGFKLDLKYRSSEKDPQVYLPFDGVTNGGQSYTVNLTVEFVLGSKNGPVTDQTLRSFNVKVVLNKAASPNIQFSNN